MDIPSIQETASVWLLHCRSRHHREPTPVLEARKWDRARVVNRAVRHRHRTAAPATWNLPVVAQLGGTDARPSTNADQCFAQSSKPLASHLLPGPNRPHFRPHFSATLRNQSDERRRIFVKTNDRHDRTTRQQPLENFF